MNFFGNVKVIRDSSCALLFGVLLGACSVEQDFEGGGIDGTGYSAGNDSGYASFYVTDAPIDEAKQVIVAFTAIEVISVDGAVTIFEFPEEKKIDLLQLQGTASETLLNNIELAVGEYQSIRLQVNAKQDDIYDSWIEMNDGTQFELNIPSGDQSGLKINHHFSISKDESLSFTIDFDLRKSLSLNENKQLVNLRPVLRIVSNDEVGHVKGWVSTPIASLLCDDLSSYTGVVYLLKGFDAYSKNNFSLDDHITSSLVKFNATEYQYEIGFIEPGNYTVFYSCDVDSAAAEKALTVDIGSRSNKNKQLHISDSAMTYSVNVIIEKAATSIADITL